MSQMWKLIGFSLRDITENLVIRMFRMCRMCNMRKVPGTWEFMMFVDRDCHTIQYSTLLRPYRITTINVALSSVTSVGKTESTSKHIRDRATRQRVFFHLAFFCHDFSLYICYIMILEVKRISNEQDLKSENLVIRMFRMCRMCNMRKVPGTWEFMMFVDRDCHTIQYSTLLRPYRITTINVALSSVTSVGKTESTSKHIRDRATRQRVFFHLAFFRHDFSLYICYIMILEVKRISNEQDLKC
ncbi:hypothetical protein DICVIV_08381 [Dictyocaulus viviparus]|uniref:Uncharacterized protein n=1 Tax=Dictyocaulus viviparus TaxID=29172 RepID=A0A0D8XP96_DICVI|nr:hypothetical protein DICVIV_08381 [Dictyocaulus viviparus]